MVRFCVYLSGLFATFSLRLSRHAHAALTCGSPIFTEHVSKSVPAVTSSNGFAYLTGSASSQRIDLLPTVLPIFNGFA